MIIQEFSSICFLNDYPSIEDALRDLLNCSKSFLKRNLSKKKLSHKVQAKYEYSFHLNILNENRISPFYTGPQIDIIFEDENIIALNKPSSVHGHPLTYLETDNCLSFLRQQGKFKALQLNSAEAERSMLYRLDFATSGVLIFCKSEETLNSWRANFFKLVKTKQYVAVVDSPGPEVGEYETYLQPYGPKGGKMREAEKGEKSQIARLKVTEKSDHKNGCLLKIELITGVRHQIRSQLQILGFPIKGDQVYEGSSFERLMLHALEYRFSISETDKYEVKSPLPELFKNFLDLNSRF